MVVHSALWCWRIWSLWSGRCHIWLQRITLGSYSENVFLVSPVKYTVLSQAENIRSLDWKYVVLDFESRYPRWWPYFSVRTVKSFVLTRPYILKNLIFYYIIQSNHKYLLIVKVAFVLHILSIVWCVICLILRIIGLLGVLCEPEG